MPNFKNLESFFLSVIINRNIEKKIKLRILQMYYCGLLRLICLLQRHLQTRRSINLYSLSVLIWTTKRMFLPSNYGSFGTRLLSRPHLGMDPFRDWGLSHPWITAHPETTMFNHTKNHKQSSFRKGAFRPAWYTTQIW